MAGNEQAIEKLKRAYRVLNVPEAASALAIKSNYRKLIKRWHPDRPATGAATAAEAMMMTKMINEAYAQIENAPLRYYVGAATATQTRQTKSGTPKMQPVNDADLSKMFFNEKKIEYAVRIVCGAISGALFGLAFSFDAFREGIEILVAILVFAVGFAAGAVKYGDKFWRVVFGKWWMWE